MKKIYTYLSMALILILGSCDALDQRPVIETDSSAVYAKAENYRMVLAKIYASYVIEGQELGGGNADLSSINGEDLLRCYFNLQEVPTEEIAYTWISGNNMSGIANMNWDINDGWVSDTYYRLYYTIALCNEFIRHCGDAEISKFTDVQQKEIREYLSEARFMRAYAYWMVLDLFRKGPYVDENTPTAGYMPEKYDGGQLFAFIESELKAIENSLAAAPEYGRAPQAAAWTLLARLYLNAEVYTGEERNTDCITYCEKVLGSGRYSLEPEFGKLFNADNHKRTNEILFSFVVDAVTTVSWGSTTYVVCGQCGNSSTQDPAKYGLSAGWGMFRVRGEVPALYGENITASEDSRCMFYTDGQTQWFSGPIDNQAEGYFSEKFSNLTDEGEPASSTQAVGCSTDWPVFRLADVYLMAAEAQLRGGSGIDRAKALEYVNEVRERAYGDGSGNITESEMTLDFILDERGREFLMEAQRRTDLIRFDKFVTADKIWQWKGGTLEGRAVDVKHNIYPIPATELTANSNLKNELY